MEIDLVGWPTFFDNMGHLLDEYKLRKTSYFHGISDNVRNEAWPFLLGLWERDSSGIQRHRIRDKLLNDYEKIRNGWINAEPELFDKDMRQFIKTIGKDVRRTERGQPFFSSEEGQGLRMLRRVLITLSVYDPELGYVQGMNEIAAPLLLTFQDESMTFWCIVKLLPLLRERLLTLDLSPQLSATADLLQFLDPDLYTHIEQLTGGHWLFCFRWFLLMFKNEFNMLDILKLWDVLFSQHNTTHFEIFVAVSILLMHKEQVIACDTSDQLLHFAQSVTAKLSVQNVINYARDLSVKIASSEGLSDNLTALVKRLDRVPPPLVGFVRRRQCFKSSYSGRDHMDDQLIRSLMSGSGVGASAAQTTPLFFNCTESPVPVPTRDYLSRIQGVQPLAVAAAPELAPPPTAPPSTSVLPTGQSPVGARTRRPDALYKDSFSARWQEDQRIQEQERIVEEQQIIQERQRIEEQARQREYQQQWNNYNQQTQPNEYTNNPVQTAVQAHHNIQAYYSTPATTSYIQPNNVSVGLQSTNCVQNPQSVFTSVAQQPPVNHPSNSTFPNSGQTDNSLQEPQQSVDSLDIVGSICDDYWDMKIAVHTDDALA